MKKILVLYESISPTYQIFRKEFNLLEKRYSLQIDYQVIHKVVMKDVLWSDIIIMIRGTSPLCTEIAKIARQTGRIFSLYYDDDLLNLPETVITSKIRINATKRVLSFTDLVITPNINISRDYSFLLLSGRTILRDSAIDISGMPDFPSITDKVGKVKLVYAANKSHDILFNKFILPIMPILCKKYSDILSLSFIGVKPDLSKFEDLIEIRYFQSMPLDEYREFIRKNQFDIGIAPIFEDEFSRRKYFNKFIEYTIAGIMGIYTESEPYTFIVEDRVNGLLSKNSDSSWLQAIGEAVENRELRRSCLAGAQKTLKIKFEESSINRQFVTDFPEILTYQAPIVRYKKSLFLLKIKYWGFRLIDRISLVILYFRKFGFSILLKTIVLHFKESQLTYSEEKSRRNHTG